MTRLRLAVSTIARPQISLAAAAIFLAAPAASAHEAWLLTPSEVSALSRMPQPELFTSTLWLGLAACLGCAVALAALWTEDRLRLYEDRLAAPLARVASRLGPLAIRLGLAIMFGLGAFGGLPRHGTAAWTQPTLFVPDMQLSLAPGWGWLAPVEAVLALVLVLGLMTRIAGLLTVLLAGFGLAAFGLPFLAYAPHFLAPGLMLLVCGGGALSLDRLLDMDGTLAPPPALASGLWSLCLVLVGGCFAYLAVSVKLTQPTLIIAILAHGQVPVMGLPLPVAALVMAGVELIAGTILALGRLTRPIALFLIGAFTFFAVTIGETPLFHANLYGTCLMLALAGRSLPVARAAAPRAALVAA